MGNKIAIIGLNAEQYEAVKKAAKAELPFTVNIRICKRQYAYNSIDIRPKAPRGNHDPFYTWNEEEFKLVLEFVLRHGLVYTSGGFIDEIKEQTNFSKFQMQHIIHGKGFNFLRMVEGKEIEVVKEVKNEIEDITTNETVSNIENEVDNVIDNATMLISDNSTGTYKHPETEEEKAAFANQLKSYITENGYNVHDILNHMNENYTGFKTIINALESMINKVESLPIVEQSEIVSETIETVILSNDATYYGFVPDTIDTLIDKINTYTLDPTFESYGDFVTEYIPHGGWTDDNVKYKGYTSIFGNFLTYSNVFRILTNNPVVIFKLTEAINKNKLTQEYQDTKLELKIDKRMKEIAQVKFFKKELSLQEKYNLSNRHSESGKVLYEQIKNELTEQHKEVTEQDILTCSVVYEPVPFNIDWGTSTRGQGKRMGKMVMGAMGDAPRGVKTYYNKYGNLPDYEAVREDVHRLDRFEEFRYVKARDYGLNHDESLCFSFGMVHLQNYWNRQNNNYQSAL